MRIEELLIENQDLEEGPLGTVGRAVGDFAGGAANAVGATIGGIRGVGDKFKQGFNSGRKYVNGVDKGAQNPKSPYYDLTGIAPDGQQGAGQQQAGGQQQAQAGGVQGQDPNQLRQQGKALIQQADELEKQQKSQQQQQQSNTQQQNTQQAQNTSGGVPTGSASNADGGSNAPANTQQQQQQNTAPANATQPPADANATPQPNATQPPANANANPPADANATPPAGTTPPANNQQQQKQAGDQRDAKSVAAATKARLQGQRQAGTSMAKSAGNNFSNWVGGSPNYKGFDAQGNAIPNKIKREDMMFKSRFLEGWI